MRLYPDKLGQHLKTTLAPIYLIAGDETLLVQECCDQIRQQCRAAGFNERQIFHVDKQFDWNLLLAENQSLSLFGDRKLLELRLPTGKPGDAGAKALREYAESASADNLLLITSGKIDKAATNSKWFKALDSAGVTVQVWPVGARELPRWLEQRFAAAGLKASDDAIALLGDRVQGNLLAAAQEIEKLKLVADGAFIDASTVSQAVADSARFDVFGYVDHCLLGQGSAALRALRGLAGEGVDPLAVLWALARELRTLYLCATDIAAGSGIERVLDNARVWDSRKTLVKTALQRHRPRRLGRLLQQANDVDRAVKGMAGDDPWVLLERLTVNLAGLPRRPA